MRKEEPIRIWKREIPMKVSALASPFLFRVFAPATLIALAFLSGCAGGRAINVNVGYDLARITKPPFEGTREMTVVLTKFKEGPSVKDEFGQWVEPRGKEDILRSSRPVNEAITDAAYEYLKRAGFNVTLAPGEVGPDAVFTPAPDLIIYGTVDEFATDAVSTADSTEITVNLKMKIMIKNTKDDSVLTVAIENVAEPMKLVVFNHDILRDTINDTLTASIERMFANTVLKDGLLRPAK